PAEGRTQLCPDADMRVPSLDLAKHPAQGSNRLYLISRDFSNNQACLLSCIGKQAIKIDKSFCRKHKFCFGQVSMSI
ncbi:MAG: hypothetical protein V4521_13940, partial [Pseudomonadota bacterium]